MSLRIQVMECQSSVLFRTRASLISRREGAMSADSGERFEEPLEEKITAQSEFEKTDDHTPTETEPKVRIENGPSVYITS